MDRRRTDDNEHRQDPPNLSPLTRAVSSFAGIGVLLFTMAGTVQWLGAWVFLFEISIGGLVTNRGLARRDPDLLAERRSTRGQVGWDRMLATIIPLLWLGWLPLMAIDAVRFQWSSVPG